ncbi:MAG TPA: phosphatase PAP2 family protein [Methylocella sp.]|nr:phosphatase PAP2 family protein [Methylocella sp.]
MLIFLLGQPFSRLRIEWDSFALPYFLIALVAAAGLAYRGLIGFPSFHTVMAFLTVQAAWKIPFAGLAALAGNILVLLAIPADGGHHFVDIAGGFFVALVSTALADAFLRQNQIAESRDLRARRAFLFVKRIWHLAKV